MNPLPEGAAPVEGKAEPTRNRQLYRRCRKWVNVRGAQSPAAGIVCHGACAIFLLTRSRPLS